MMKLEKSVKDIENIGNMLNHDLSFISSSNNLTEASKRSVSKGWGKYGKVIGKGKRLRMKRGKLEYHPPFIKYGSLLLLIVQMVGLVLLLRYSRIPNDSNDLYLASTAVLLMEIMKLVICNSVIFMQVGSSPYLYVAELKKHIVNTPREVLKLSVPSLLYTVQNNLLYLALTNLDASTYQVCYQLKILTTAIFSMIMMKRKFSIKKWLALLMLAAGVSIIQISGSGDYSMEEHHRYNLNNRLVGLVSVIFASCTSGFSGIYFEKVIKGSVSSLWIRNIQMGLPSIIFAFITVLLKDLETVQKKGFFGGYTFIVWIVVIVQASGGLIVALVVKYADSVLKVFASSISIVVSCVISILFLDFHPNFWFVCGTFLVVTSTVLYSKPEMKAQKGLKRQNLSLMV